MSALQGPRDTDSLLNLGLALFEAKRHNAAVRKLTVRVYYAFLIQ